MAGTSSGTTALDSATRELTRAVLLFSLDARARPQHSASGRSSTGSTSAASSPI
ncbi:hypothetical protein M2271_002352 [Streptomyces sp. LBL]|uniref:hypothetical protein n=1 Tax=Streptomyces sp. LBL TaxID=2940562 RepID=UPI002476A973|nr:hypothetical protein [Streptomyces sp. LBL]MDH6624548.1 hypothetical protein [Streptomyces sp. LBL]